MPFIESRAGDEDKLEDLLTTFPLLRSSSSTAPLEVTLVANKPNAIVRPIPRPPVIVKDTPPPRQDESLVHLEAQIHRTSHEMLPSASHSESKKYPPGLVTVIPKKKLIPMDPVLHKPLFITTVPSGVFLEKSSESVESRRVYNYSSAPRVLRSIPNIADSTSSFLSKVSNCLTAKKSYFTSSSSESKSQRFGR